MRLPGTYRVSGYARARGRRFEDVAVTRKPTSNRLTLPEIDLRGVSWFLCPFVEAYCLRDLGEGVVARRAFLENALKIEDEEVLSHLVDPRSGEPLFPELVQRRLSGEGTEGWGSEEIRRKRREGLMSFVFRGERGVEIHDLSKPRPIPERTPRGLVRDQEALRILRDDGPERAPSTSL